MDKKSISHTAWKCQFHLVFIPKYRKKKLYGQVRADVGYLKGKSALMIFERMEPLFSGSR